MTQEEKGLLLKDVSARLPYDCKVTIAEGGIDGLQWNNVTLNSYLLCQIEEEDSWEYIKPYLRPMSSMTEEECIEFGKLPVNFENISEILPNAPYYIEIIKPEQIDWLNKNMFDYRGLIEKGLALEALEEMYKEE